MPRAKCTRIVYNRLLYLWLVLDEYGAVLYEAVSEQEAIDWMMANRG